ncbi:MAG: hypothetical protein M1814_003481 [Vezdaea aestivalis]|nr:MAG: hypothetical protein M1814_003481 [Vezdaea aestivalis]
MPKSRRRTNRPSERVSSSPDPESFVYVDPISAFGPSQRPDVARLNLTHKTESLTNHIIGSETFLKEAIVALNDLKSDRTSAFSSKCDRRSAKGQDALPADQEKLNQFCEKVVELNNTAADSFRDVVDEAKHLERIQQGLIQVQQTAQSGSDGPVNLFTRYLEDSKETWDAMRPADKYASNERTPYYQFMQEAHEALYPNGDAPPLPRVSKWFSGPGHEDGNESSSSADLDITGEKKSLKCLLTLQDFVDPLTSTTCGHSFERHAIDGLFSNATMHEAGRPIIRCPACNVQYTRDKLIADPILARRVQRAKEREERLAAMDNDDDDEEDVEEEEGFKQTSPYKKMGPVRSATQAERIKREATADRR